MGKEKGHQVLTKTDLKILDLLVKKGKPVLKTSIAQNLGKYHNRVCDRIKVLEEYKLIKIEGNSKRNKPYQIVKKEEGFVKLLLKRFLQHNSLKRKHPKSTDNEHRQGKYHISSRY